jgi:hypothetical protein
MPAADGHVDERDERVRLVTLDPRERPSSTVMARPLSASDSRIAG